MDILLNYKATYENCGEAYVNRLNKELGLDGLEFKGIDSPTNKLEIYIGDVDEQRIYDGLDDANFLEWANPHGIEGIIENSEYNTYAYSRLIELLIEFQIDKIIK